MRDYFTKEKLLERIVDDVSDLLRLRAEVGIGFDTEIIHLWDEKTGIVAHGVSYGKYEDDERVSLKEGYGKFVEVER